MTAKPHSRETVVRLRKRPEFLRVAAVRRKWATPGLLLQVALMLPSISGAGHAYRYGVTASRKVGGAVERNRAKRRLRVLAESLLPDLARPGYDFVLIARTESVSRPWPLLISDLKTALARLKVTRPKPSSDGPEGGEAVDGAGDTGHKGRTDYKDADYKGGAE